MRHLGLIVGLLVFFLSPTTGRALDDSQAARLDHAKRLMEASNEKELRAAYVDLYSQESVRTFRQWRPESSQDDISSFEVLMRDELGAEYDKLTILKIHYYAARFTVQELDAWTAMLQSEIGKKIAKAAPSMQRDLFPIQRGALQEALTRATNRLDDLRKAGGHT